MQEALQDAQYGDLFVVSWVDIQDGSARGDVFLRVSGGWRAVLGMAGLNKNLRQRVDQDYQLVRAYALDNWTIL